MTTTLRQAARELLSIATEVREIAARLDAPPAADLRWAAARDLRATAFTIERQAAFAEKRGTELGEPDPSVAPSWLASEPPDVARQVMGR